MRYGRLYRVHRDQGVDLRGRLNTDHFVILADDADQIRVTPKPYAGIPVSDDQQLETQLQETLSASDKEQHYLAIAVWEDSFDRFVFLKNAIVDMGFEYRLIPIEENSIISEGGGGQPLVQ